MHTSEVVIAGGGLAGLHAAHLLHKVGVDAVLLEAAPRLGGRILSATTVDNSVPGFDLGPTWFWNHQPRIRQLLHQLQLPVFEQYSQGDALYQVDYSQEPERFASGGMPTSYRVVGGTAQLTHALAKSLPQERLLTQHAVFKLEREGEEWLVGVHHHQKEKTFRCKHLALALPPRIIQRDLKPASWLGEPFAKALSAVPTWMAGQAKFVGIYETPFWRELGLSGQVMSRCGPMMEIHDASIAEEEGFALFGFLGWPAAARKSYGQEVLIASCQKQLESLFGKPASQLKHRFLKDWANDPWITTAADLQGPSMHPHLDLNPFKDNLRSKNLHLISTEFATQEAGYLEGALIAAESGVAQIKASKKIQD